MSRANNAQRRQTARRNKRRAEKEAMSLRRQERKANKVKPS
jgi:hypothetical protein